MNYEINTPVSLMEQIGIMESQINNELDKLYEEKLEEKSKRLALIRK